MRMEEAAALHDRDTERVKALTDQLHMAQSMLYDSTKDYLDLKYESRARERGWVQEKDQLLRQMDHYREQLDESQGIDPVLGMNFTNITPWYIYNVHVTYIVRVKSMYNCASTEGYFTHHTSTSKCSHATTVREQVCLYKTSIQGIVRFHAVQNF